MYKVIALPIVLAVTSSFADPPRYKRETHAPPRVDTPVPVKKPKPATPAVRGDDVLAGELRAQPIRAEQEAILLQLVTDMPDTDPDKPEILFRLAEHYARQEQIWRIKAYSDFDK